MVHTRRVSQSNPILALDRSRLLLPFITMAPATASSSKDTAKAEDKATKDPSQSLGVLEEDDEFEEFAAAGTFRLHREPAKILIIDIVLF